jgi:hypothetical protein
MKTFENGWKREMMSVHDLKQFKKGSRDGFIGTNTWTIRIKGGIDVFIRIESTLVLLPFENTRVNLFFYGMNVTAKSSIIIGKRALVVP